jgi:hypothetical protein
VQGVKLFLFLSTMAASSASLSAQWPKYTEAGLPRDAQGQVKMDSPAPRTADGKPDLSGLWNVPFPPRPPADGKKTKEGDAAPSKPPTPPADPKVPPIATFAEIGANIPGGLQLTPWAADIKKKRKDAEDRDNPDANCLPIGFTQFHMHPQPRKIVQLPKMIIILYEGNYGIRYIYMDGRPLPPQGDPQAWWYGYSIGHWEGDTLVVETNNVRGAESGPHDGWLDVNGNPYSDQAQIVERFHRPNFGNLEIDFTLNDPKSYTKPFTVRINQRLLVDQELIETICNENQQFGSRINIDK